MSTSKKTINRLQKILEGPYQLSKNTILYAEVETGEMMLSGLTELRDTADHIAKALSASNEKKALAELECAKEHLRRGAVESIQKAAVKIYSETKDAMSCPSFVIRLTGNKIGDRGKAKKLRKEATKHIIEGRTKKANQSTWVKSIDEFQKAIEKCQEIQDMFPEKGTVFKDGCTIGSFIFAVVMFFLWLFNIRFF